LVVFLTFTGLSSAAKKGYTKSEITSSKNQYSISSDIAVIVLIIAGLTYITSGGNEQKTSGAKSTIVYAVVGLVIVLFAQTIVYFTINKVK